MDRCLRGVRRGLVAAAAMLGLAAPAVAAPPAPEPPVPTESFGLIPVPAGCAVPDPADVTFVGTVVDKDGYIDKGTVRFRIDQIRAGNASRFSVQGLVDVRYGPDSKYLDVDTAYLIGARVDPSIGALTSKVTPDTPLFGGDAVVGVEDTAVECPALDDPVMTLHVDGSPVESGVLSPLFADRTLLLATIGVPAAIVGAVLVGLVLLRRVWGWFVRAVLELGRAAVTPAPDHVATRVRHHRVADDGEVVEGTSVFGMWRTRAGGGDARPGDVDDATAAAGGSGDESADLVERV